MHSWNSLHFRQHLARFLSEYFFYLQQCSNQATLNYITFTFCLHWFYYFSFIRVASGADNGKSESIYINSRFQKAGRQAADIWLGWKELSVIYWRVESRKRTTEKLCAATKWNMAKWRTNGHKLRQPKSIKHITQRGNKFTHICIDAPVCVWGWKGIH